MTDTKRAVRRQPSRWVRTSVVIIHKMRMCGNHSSISPLTTSIPLTTRDAPIMSMFRDHLTAAPHALGRTIGGIIHLLLGHHEDDIPRPSACLEGLGNGNALVSAGLGEVRSNLNCLCHQQGIDLICHKHDLLHLLCEETRVFLRGNRGADPQVSSSFGSYRSHGNFPHHHTDSAGW